MKEDELLSFFSASAQVLAAMVALLAVFVQFKLREISEYLVGSGRVLLARWEEYEGKGFLTHLKDPDSSLTHGQIRDAVDRWDTDEIGEHLRRLADAQEKAGQAQLGRSLLTEHTRYDRLKRQYSNLNDASRLALVTSVLGVFTALYGTATDQSCFRSCCVYPLTWLWNISVFVLVVYAGWLGMRNHAGRPSV